MTLYTVHGQATLTSNCHEKAEQTTGTQGDQEVFKNTVIFL